MKANNTIKIFISHSHGDKPVADALVDLIEHCCDVNAAEVFCSSVEGLGGENGKILSEDVKEKLLESTFVITYLTKNYRNSEFCLAELGAVWILSEKKKFIPLKDPSVSKDIFHGVVAGVHVGNVSEETISNMIDEIRDKYPKSVPSIRITRKVKEFADEYLEKVKNCSPCFFISEDEWNAKNDELEEYFEKNAKLEDELRKLKKENELLKKAKSKEDVENAELVACEDVIEQYEILEKNVKECMSVFNKYTRRFILLDYYGIKNPDRVEEYTEYISESCADDYLYEDDNGWPSVNYDEETVKDYVSALDKFKEFLEDDDNYEEMSKYFKRETIQFNTKSLRFYRSIFDI